MNSGNTCLITTETIIKRFRNCSSSVRIFVRLISNLICLIYPETLRHAGVCNVYAVLVNSSDRPLTYYSGSTINSSDYQNYDLYVTCFCIDCIDFPCFLTTLYDQPIKQGEIKVIDQDQVKVSSKCWLPQTALIVSHWLTWSSEHYLDFSGKRISYSNWFCHALRPHTITSTNANIYGHILLILLHVLIGWSVHTLRIWAFKLGFAMVYGQSWLRKQL